jgi:Arc/MetJ family transcription regulator
MMHNDMHEICIQQRDRGMRTTLNLSDELITRAAELTGIEEKTALVRLGLEALIARESARRLARLGGTEKRVRAPRRRRAGK